MKNELNKIVKHIKPVAGWNNILSNKSLTKKLKDIAVHELKQRELNIAGRTGIRKAPIFATICLFTGENESNRNIAAEVLAKELSSDLFMIDLGKVVSKYIGETDKNLRRIFDAAKDSDVILFFDEADALFGKRTEVKDSHDRYSNLEINNLLQQIEAFSGLVILATNLKTNLDPAFIRRIRYKINFPLYTLPQN